MTKINIAKILKDCPSGMELDCPMYDGLEFDSIDERNSPICPIVCRVKTKSGHCRFYTFTKYGCCNSESHSKCVIFPKGKTTWEGFQRPFKDGDILAYDNKSAHATIFIYRYDNLSWNTSYFVALSGFSGKFLHDATGALSAYNRDVRFATEEEKQKLFKAIKDNGYKWNPQEKTLEKLITLKFKIGDKIRAKGTNSYTKILGIKWDQTETYYETPLCEISVKDQDKFELVPNKFDITTLKAFDKVLVRDNDELYWSADFYSNYLKKNTTYKFMCIGTLARQCIPFEDNKHLLGTTDDCDNFYKTWE